MSVLSSRRKRVAMSSEQNYVYIRTERGGDPTGNCESPSVVGDGLRRGRVDEEVLREFGVGG